MEERNDQIPEPREGAAEAPDAQPQAQAPDAQLAELRAELARTKEEAERNWQQFLHAAADLENYKKQASRQREDAVQRARYSLLGVILTVVDNLERALEHGAGADGEKILEGIRMTHRHVLDVLARMGVTPMETTGRPFDPRFHEAVDTAPHAEHGVEQGTIVAELQRGYMLNGEVLRPAKVRVAK